MVGHGDTDWRDMGQRDIGWRNVEGTGEHGGDMERLEGHGGDWGPWGGGTWEDMEGLEGGGGGSGTWDTGGTCAGGTWRGCRRDRVMWAGGWGTSGDTGDQQGDVPVPRNPRSCRVVPMRGGP